MRFEARDLKPYAEPVSPGELKRGETYFAVLFLDDNGLIPVLEPKVFIGRDLESGDGGKFYFQDYISYRHGIRFDTATSVDESNFETGVEKHVFEYERALDVLMTCALKRKRPSKQE
jgi:hypothetical protein